MSNFSKALAFGLFVIGAYTLFAVAFVPDTAQDLRTREDMSISGLKGASAEELSALGERIYNGKGACSLCHNAAGGRAPGLDDLSDVAAMRIAGSSYKGSATSAREYVVESLIDPSAFVVVGYGVIGSGDTASPMPDVSKEPIGLSEEELQAVTEYLMGKGRAR